MSNSPLNQTAPCQRRQMTTGWYWPRTCQRCGLAGPCTDPDYRDQSSFPRFGILEESIVDSPMQPGATPTIEAVHEVAPVMRTIGAVLLQLQRERVLTWADLVMVHERIERALSERAADHQ